jgi:hypothetical protein
VMTAALEFGTHALRRFATLHDKAAVRAKQRARWMALNALLEAGTAACERDSEAAAGSAARRRMTLGSCARRMRWNWYAVTPTLLRKRDAMTDCGIGSPSPMAGQTAHCISSPIAT